MKRICFINGSMLPKRLLIPLFAGFVFIVLWACDKKGDTSEQRNEIADSNNKSSMTSGINASLLGAIPNDGKDDTKAIQDAIDQAEANGGGTVSLSAGNYNINADTSIYLKSNVILSMPWNAYLLADTNSDGRYAVIKAVGIHDAKVVGGRIIGDRDYHIGTTGEWGYGINIMGSDHIQIVDTRISKCWGDGLIVGASGSTTSTNITIKGVWSRNNRRQAISVIEVDGLLIDTCQLYNTDGTAPKDGIDIEPDLHSTPRTAQNITITHCDIYSNLGNGVEINARKSSDGTVQNIIKNVTIQYNRIHDNAYSGYCQNADNVNFTDNWLYANKYGGNLPHNTNCTNSVFTPNTYAPPQ